MSYQLADILSSLDMSADSGLVFTTNIGDAQNPSEIIAIDQAQRLGAKAVYFRRMARKDNISGVETYTSLPQIYIYDEDFNDEQLVDIHRILWSSGVVPFFYVITNTQVKIFSCTRRAEQIDNGLVVRPFKEFFIASDIIDNYKQEKFSTKLFDNGSLWQQEEFFDLLNPHNGPYETLLRGLLAAKENLTDQAKEHDISELTISKLLIMCILVKYLEEKIDDEGQKLFEIDRDFLNKFGKDGGLVTKFTDVLRSRQAVEFFESLSEKFSGNVFQFSSNEKRELLNTNLSFVADVFDAKMTSSGQYVIWDLYSFNYLPIELISGIYEAFLNHGPQPRGNKGIVYTPPYLVNFLIDECMPLDKAEEYFKNEDFKVLDPACGSGIFLVSAFKRMVQWKAILNYKNNNKIQYPGLSVVKRIIRNNIFGVDVENESTRLTIFSLCIAICEKLSPMQIWKDLQFDDLNQNNIRTNNFFAYFNDNDNDGLQRESFELVIGNPPFNPPGGITNKEYFNYLVKKYPVKPSAPIHDNNLAIHFLDRCMRFPKRGKVTCLILPSGALLYNNNAHSYRKHFLETHTVNKIIDFTHLSDALFYGRANVAVCVLIAQNSSPVTEPPILHTVVHRAKVAEKRYFFEIDHYDFNSVRFKIALNNPYVWKANLLGGGRLLRLINRLSQLQTIKSYLKDKTKKDGWVEGEGYIINHDGSTNKEDLLRKGYKTADWITNKESLITESFTEDSNGQVFIESETVFHWPRDKRLFTPPHVLIRKHLGKKGLTTQLSDKYLCFKNQVVGVHAPHSQRADLERFYNSINRNGSLYRFFLISTSGRSGISLSPSTLLKADILNLPYSDEEEDTELSISEKIVKDDVINYLIKLGRNTNESILFRRVTEDQVVNFGNTFCDAINPIYGTKENVWRTDSFIIKDQFIGYAFCYGRPKAKPIVNWDDDDPDSIYKLIYNETFRNARITRVLRAYIHIDGYDVLILIKPNLMRYWLKSVALRDTDETFADLKRAGF